MIVPQDLLTESLSVKRKLLLTRRLKSNIAEITPTIEY